MISFHKKENDLELRYQSDGGDNNWVMTELKGSGSVIISSVFHFKLGDLVNPPAGHDEKLEGHEYRFRLGTINEDYVCIPGQKLDIKNDVALQLDIKLERKIFAAERNISIFGRLSKLLEHSRPIIVGGTRNGAIPIKVFEELLSKFPGTYELNRYAGARVTTILSQYLDGLEDARGKYENYLNRKMGGTSALKFDLDFLKKFEVEKYILIRGLIKDALKSKSNISEAEWQNLMLSFLLILFPKYIKIIEKVTIDDYYTNPDSKTSRYLDIALIDANGSLDIIEIKKPFDDKIFRKSQYRSNSIPTAELSGSIMQAEKYLFHLSKWGVAGEKALTRRYSAELPKGMNIRISNPKAIIIVGRDEIGGMRMNTSQILDFEIIKRKYANMLDIITYDDLLRRLDNMIISLGAATKSPP